MSDPQMGMDSPAPVPAVGPHRTGRSVPSVVLPEGHRTRRGIGDLASPTEHRMPRQNDDGRHPGRSAERHLRVRPRMRFTGHFESEVLAPVLTHPTCRSGVLGRRSRFAARPLRWSDLDRLLELADGPAPCQISIPEPVFRDARRMLRKKPGNVKKVDGHNEPPHSLGEALAVLRRRRRVFVRGRSINEWLFCPIRGYPDHPLTRATPASA